LNRVGLQGRNAGVAASASRTGFMALAERRQPKFIERKRKVVCP